MRRTRSPIGGWRCLVAAAAVLAAGCASDLSNDADVNKEVVIAMPTDAPAPTEVVRAVWFPNANGFRATDQSLVHVTGVLALAGDKLWFMAWNDHEHHYDMLHVVDFIQADKVGVDRFGTGAMLVVQSGNDSFDSYQLMGKGQFASDPKETEQLYQAILALRAKSPAPTQ